MVKSSLIALLFVCSVFAQIATENSALASKANSADFYLIQNGTEYWHKSFTQSIPYSDRELYHLPSFDSYQLYGKEYPMFKALPLSPISRVQVGNEVGDPLFQELAYSEAISNRTPMTEAVVYSPRVLGWELFGGIEQVDHFSSGDMQYKQIVLDRETPHFDAAPYAWFGENYPHYSSLIFGGSKNFTHGQGLFSHRSGWLWVNLRGSGRLLPYENRVTSAQIQVNEWLVLGRFNWKRYLGDDTLAHYSSYTSDYAVEYSKKSSDQVSHRVGVDISLRSSDEIIEYSSRHSVIPYAAFEFNDKNSLSLKQCIAYNGSYFLLRDSMVIRSDDTLQSVGFNGYVANRINPQNDYKEIATIGYSDTLDATIKELMQVYAVEARYGDRIEWAEWQLFVSPWIIFNPHYFDLTETYMDSGYLLRKGAYKSHSDNVWGFKSALSGVAHPLHALTLSGVVQLQKSWGPAKRALDFLESELSAQGSVVYETRLGLSVSLSSVFLTTRYLNNWGSEPFEIDGGWEHNITVRQSLFNQKLSFWVSALNIGSNDKREHPNGADDRFRMIAGVEWRY